MVKGSIRRIALTVVLVLVCIGLIAGPAVAEGSIYNFDYRVNATVHLQKLDQTATVPPGRFTGFIDFGNGALLGSITLPLTTVQLSLAGVVPLVTATFKIIPTKKVTGYVDLNTFNVTATATFNLQIIKAYAATAKSVNLVGSTCTTAKPISVTMSGPASIGGSSTFSGIFSIPFFKTCGRVTTALDEAVSGPGNTFVAVATPL